MTAQILNCTASNIQRAAEALRAGDVVAAPTETVYGLAGRVFDPSALAKIFAVKERPTFDPLIVHVAAPEEQQSDVDWLAVLERQQVIDPQAISQSQARLATALAKAFWPGPLTMVLPKSARIPDLATSGLQTVAVRAPARLAMQALIRAVGEPLAAPSANRFGSISPTTAEDVSRELGDRIRLILDDGPCEIGLESTIVHIRPDGELVLLRPGGTPKESLERVVGHSLATDEPRLGASPASMSFSKSALLAPGALPSHYAPQKPLRLLSRAIGELSEPEWAQLTEQCKGERGVGLLAQQGDEKAIGELLARRLAAVVQADAIEVRTLSSRGDDSEAARNLFGYLRQLDENPGTSILFAEPVRSAQGLHFAIADRLARASAKFASSRAEKPSQDD